MRIETPFRPRDLIELLRPHLPTKYSPLTSDGDGLQSVYLAAVAEGMALVLLPYTGHDLSRERLSLSAESGDETVEKLDDAVEAAIRNNTEIDETERKAVVSARCGQGRFRQNVESIEKLCRVTGVTDQRLLRASHIKPWRSCATNHERLDGYNGLLLAPHIDHLFDRGYISFAINGELMVSSKVRLDQLGLMGMRLPMNVGPFSPEQDRYLAHHREVVFRP